MNDNEPTVWLEERLEEIARSALIKGSELEKKELSPIDKNILFTELSKTYRQEMIRRIVSESAFKKG